jgi:LPXTG-motif cell wall-anchored protein
LLFREEIAQEELVNPDVKDKFFTLPLLLALGLLVVAGTAVHYIRRKKREGS